MLSKLPWTPTAPLAKPRQYKLRKDRRNHLIDLTATKLRCGEPTLFAFEARCRHALRAKFCLDGWPWVFADLAAADIIRNALQRIGATRPRWIEGQRNFVQLGALMLCNNCHNCGKLLLGQLNQRYCGDACRGQFHGQVVRPWLRDGDAYKSAARMTRGLDEQHNA